MNAKLLAKTPIKDLTFCVVDTETTGMSAKYNRIMDIGVVKVKNGEITEEWETLIDPQQEIPYWITHYTNLSATHVRGKATFDVYSKKIAELLEGGIFVGHNVGFDYAFLLHEMTRAGFEFFHPKLCTVLLGRKLLPQLANAHLDAISSFYRIAITQRHRALPDAQATAKILLNFIQLAQEKYAAQTYFDLEKLQRIKIAKQHLYGATEQLL